MLGADGRVQQTRVAAWLCLFPVFSGPQVAHLRRRFVHGHVCEARSSPLRAGRPLLFVLLFVLLGFRGGTGDMRGSGERPRASGLGGREGGLSDAGRVRVGSRGPLCAPHSLFAPTTPPWPPEHHPRAVSRPPPAVHGAPAAGGLAVEPARGPDPGHRWVSGLSGGSSWAPPGPSRVQGLLPHFCPV